MASCFSRQLRFAQALIDSYARLTADAVFKGNIDFAKSLACSFVLAKKFYDSRMWYDWKCSTYKIFVEKFSEVCSKGFIEV